MTSEPAQPFDLAGERWRRGLSIRALATATGVHQHTIRALEGTLERPVKPENAKKVADYFEIEVTDLVTVDGMSRAKERTAA